MKTKVEVLQQVQDDLIKKSKEREDTLDKRLEAAAAQQARGHTLSQDAERDCRVRHGGEHDGLCMALDIIRKYLT